MEPTTTAALAAYRTRKAELRGLMKDGAPEALVAALGPTCMAHTVQITLRPVLNRDRDDAGPVDQ